MAGGGLVNSGKMAIRGERMDNSGLGNLNLTMLDGMIEDGLLNSALVNINMGLCSLRPELHNCTVMQMGLKTEWILPSIQIIFITAKFSLLLVLV